MTGISLTVNGLPVRAEAEPRMHLADFLRERLRLTATHLRCEQGVCGACTLLIDGQPARSCITYAVACEGAEVTTLEGLADDPVIEALRAAFHAEHGLQCGFCTPGMLTTARDIVLRLPDADAARVRLELSGNLCRCTGYAGIVRAVAHVLAERRGQAQTPPPARALNLAPVGARPELAGASAAQPVIAHVAPVGARANGEIADTDEAGLGGRRANFETPVSITIARPIDDVWLALSDVVRMVRCMPGAELNGPPSEGRIVGSVSIKVGPIATSFSGNGRIERDEVQRRGVLYGAGRDRFSGSSARAEVEYALHRQGEGATRVDLTVRALLTGPLAQFGRSGIVQALITRVGNEFAHRLEHSLVTGEDLPSGAAPLNPAALLWSVTRARIGGALARLFGKHNRPEMK